MSRKKRGSPISYRPPEGRRAELEVRISGSGLPRNAFFTAALFGEVPRSKTRRSASLDRQMVGELLSQAARLHDDLVLLKARPFAPSESITQALRELVEIRTCLMLALGKDP